VLTEGFLSKALFKHQKEGKKPQSSTISSKIADANTVGMAATRILEGGTRHVK
jgi:hypothetical protein